MIIYAEIKGTETKICGSFHSQETWPYAFIR